MQIIHNVPPVQPKNKWVAIDTEWFGMKDGLLHLTHVNGKENGTFACTTVCTEPDVVYLITDPILIPRTITNINECVWVMHNAKFDITHLRRFAHIPPRKKLWDTLLIERILFGGYYDTFGLDDLARRYLHIALDKSLQKAFQKAEVLDDALINYSVTDPDATLKIAFEQRKIVTNSDVRIWHEVDRPALFAFLDFMPVRMDTDGWKQLSIDNYEAAKTIDETIPFNPRSPAQVKSNLAKNGWKGIPNTNEKTIIKYLKKKPNVKAAEWAKAVLQSRKLSKHARTYGTSFIEKYLSNEGDYQVLKADYQVTGAETGRTACRNPNLMNVPTRETDAYRKRFIARPGHKLIIADYSQQEPCISAYLSQDPNLIKATQGNDVYIGTAKIMYKEQITKSDPRRKKMKSIFLGLGYGMSNYGLAEREGISVDEADELMTDFFTTFKGMKHWMDRQTKEKRLVRTVLGRKVWLNPYNGQCERNALNGPIQGTAADMFKKALGRIHQNWKFNCPFAVVLENHDELVLDVIDELVEDVTNYVKTIMEETANEMCSGISFKVGISIGESWAEKE